MKIEEVFDLHEKELMGLTGVIGIGIGQESGNSVILVMVENLTQELRQQIPTVLGGYSVKIEIMGMPAALQNTPPSKLAR